MKKVFLSLAFVASIVLTSGLNANNNTTLNLTKAEAKSCSGGCDKMIFPFFRTMCNPCKSVMSSWGGCRSTCTPSSGGNT